MPQLCKTRILGKTIIKTFVTLKKSLLLVYKPSQYFVVYSLEDEYNKVSRGLESKLKLFNGAKERDELQHKANTLASNINDKRKELQG